MTPHGMPASPDPRDMPPVATVMSTLHRMKPELDSRRLSARLGELGVSVSASTLREFARGVRPASLEPRRSTLAALAAAFEVPVAVFFDWASLEELDRRLNLEASERAQLG